MFRFEGNNTTFEMSIKRSNSEYAHCFIQDIQGIDVGEVYFRSENNPSGVGENVLSKNALGRKIQITLGVDGRNQTEKETNRQRILKAFRNKRGKFYWEKDKDYHLNVIVVKLAELDRFSKVSKYELEFFADNPNWYSDTVYVTEQKTTPRGVTFPFAIEPLVLEGGKVLKIENAGDEPCFWEIKATGIKGYLKLINERTGEKIEIENDFISGDIITITNQKDNISIYKENGGIRENITNRISLKTNFFKLLEGNNVIRVDTTYECDPIFALKFQEEHINI